MALAKAQQEDETEIVEAEAVRGHCVWIRSLSMNGDTFGSVPIDVISSSTVVRVPSEGGGSGDIAQSLSKRAPAIACLLVTERRRANTIRAENFHHV